MLTTKKTQTKQVKVNSISFKDKQVGGSLLSEWSSRCEDFMLSRDSLFDSGHRIDHVRRVLHNALALASHEDAQIDIILPAVWLHDCVPVDKHSPKRSMASQLSADYALSLLSQWGYPSSLLQPIHHAIAAHSFSANITPTTLEAKMRCMLPMNLFLVHAHLMINNLLLITFIQNYSRYTKIFIQRLEKTKR